MAFDSAPQSTPEQGSQSEQIPPREAAVDFDAIFNDPELEEKYKGHTGGSLGQEVADFDPNATGAFDTMRIIRKEDKKEGPLH